MELIELKHAQIDKQYLMNMTQDQMDELLTWIEMLKRENLGQQKENQKLKNTLYSCQRNQSEQCNSDSLKE